MIGVILNGGNSERFGEDKSTYLLRTKTMIEHVYQRLTSVFDRVVLVGKPYKNMQYVEDQYKTGPVGGVLTALNVLKDNIFVVGCDMPFVQPAVIRKMWSHFEKSNVDAVVPKLLDGIHPLHAFYNVSIKENLIWSMKYADSSFHSAFDRAEIDYLTEDFFKTIPDWEWSFFNINTKSDLRFLEVNRCSGKPTGLDMTGNAK
ncbi:MAG TPA: molybdenum cofactor guanylyltransferase [Pseudothermotoga sp.]|nr:molybdenum cofactor guanylyltransferase [Pseudothermotoga sp.]HOK82824.1 molybdenum cofactor guanylyltransferase [Pseudothermotoga sp.]HPP70002.1 molybdenum cofactor guanylyltransferase [Pseudothermotoga sp.]